MFLLFTFSDGSTKTSDFLLDSAKLTECFYNELKYADNSATVRVPFNEDLCDKIKAEISKNIKVQIKENGSNLFTGYTRKTVSFSKTQRNQPFSLEIVSPSILFDKVYSGTVQHFSNTTLSEIVINLLSLSDYSGEIDISKISNVQIKIFKIHDGDKIKDVLNELLYEYGYCYDFDKDGNFYINYMFETAPLQIEQKFNGDNCLTEIQQQVKEDKYNRVSVVWNKVEQQTDVLIFEDTTGANENEKANIPISAQSYYLDTQTNYLQYDSKFQEIEWIDSATATIKFDNAEGITKTFRNLGNQGELSIYNNSSSARTITELSVKGSGFFQSSTNYTKVGSSGTETEIQAKYIQKESDASLFAKKLADYYNYSNFLIQVKSKTKFDLGSFVEVSDNGIGTIRCRVIKRVWDIRKNVFEYSLESISEYNPAETYTTQQHVNSRGDNGETLRDTVSDLSDRINSIQTETTMVGADVLSAIIKLDNEGKTITTQDITTTISLKRNDEDLDFSIGTINLPTGWTYTINGKQITFHVAEGVSLSSGQFSIPVLYKTVISENYYVNENGDQYVNENGESYGVQVMSGSYTQWKLYFNYFGDNGGVYLGMITELNQIPSQNNYGDFFTWGGSETVSALSYDGKFLQGRVYKYVGTKKSYQWSQDIDGGHNQIALSDILGISGADLKNNNSTVYEYLDHLTSNSIYTEMIVANQAYIDSLIANESFINELSSNSLFAKKLSSNSAFIDDLVSNTAFVGELGSNSIFANAVKSSEGFFDNITVSGLINGATGEVHDLKITGDSSFEGTIESGPLSLSNSSPTPVSTTLPARTHLTEGWTLNNVNGSYNGKSFDRAIITVEYRSFDEGFGHYQGNYYCLYLYKNGSYVADYVNSGSLYNPSAGQNYHTLSYSMSYTYINGTTKTMKFKDIPIGRVSEKWTVYAESDGTLKVVL